MTELTGDSSEPQKPQTLDWVGRTLGGYKIESETGRGGMATVYRAYQAQLERWVAIKVLAPLKAGDATFLAAFRREAKAIAALRHPNILTVHDYGEQDGVPYIVMEYISGGTLNDKLTGHPLRWSEVASLIVPIAQALAYAHTQGVIHCDVKPSNILLQQPNWPLLADFGLLKLRGSPSSDPGLMSGTPAYVSPEQATGDRVGSRSDIYSLGVVLYELITGQLPFKAGTPGTLLLQRLLELPPPPTLFNPNISGKLEQIILRTLAREPVERFQDMEELIDELLALPEQGTGPVSPLANDPEADSTKGLKDHSAPIGEHLIVVGTETVLPLPKKVEVVLGRADPRASKQPDIDLGPPGGLEAGVSRLHARLIYTVEGWTLEDLGSTNGTSLNMGKIEPGDSARVRSGDVLRCGRLMLVFYEE